MKNSRGIRDGRFTRAMILLLSIAVLLTAAVAPAFARSGSRRKATPPIVVKHDDSKEQVSGQVTAIDQSSKASITVDGRAFSLSGATIVTINGARSGFSMVKVGDQATVNYTIHKKTRADKRTGQTKSVETHGGEAGAPADSIAVTR